MISDALAFMMPNLVELLVVLIVWAISAVVIILIVRHLIRSNKERQKLGLETVKLADELQQLREDLKRMEQKNFPPCSQ